MDAAKIPILVDQFTYLIAHQENRKCPPDCLDCTRLHGIAAWCMLPFHEAKYDVPHTMHPKPRRKAA